MKFNNLPGSRSISRSVALLSGIALIVALAVGRPLYAATFPIARDGKPVAIIHVDANASESDKAAADDLQKYVKQISGATLSISSDAIPENTPAILIGQSQEVSDLAGNWLDAKYVGADGYLIRTYYTTRAACDKDAPDRLVVAGPDNGTRYAVFRLLHELGCRFYAPHEDGECIPDKRTLEIGDVSLLIKPAFVMRSLWMNGWYCGGDDAQRAKALEAFEYWLIKNGGRGQKIRIGHNLDTVVDPKKNFATHPEWFALAPGKSGKLVRGGMGAPDVPGAPPDTMQPCLSNPEVQKLFVDTILEKFQGKQGESFSLSPADTGPDRWCQCDKCKAMDGEGGLAQRMVTFANLIAAQVEQKAPGNYLPFYVEYYLPGKPVADDGTIRIRCHPSLIPTFVNTYCPYHDPRDPNCARSAEMRWAMSAWDRVSSDIAIYDYRMWALLLPNPSTWSVGRRIQFFHECGINRYSCELIGGSPDADLSSYITTRMLWDPSQDPDRIVDEFFDRYYEEVSAPMKAYYRHLNDIFKDAHQNGDVKYGRVIDRRAIQGLRQRLKPAIEQAKKDVVKRRLERERLALDIYSAMVDMWTDYNEWKNENHRTPEIASRINASIDRMDSLLSRVDGMMLVAERPNSKWWTMQKEGIRKDIGK